MASDVLRPKEEILRNRDGVALVKDANGEFHIALIAGSFRHDYKKTYKRVANAMVAWNAKLGEVHGTRF